MDLAFFVSRGGELQGAIGPETANLAEEGNCGPLFRRDDRKSGQLG